MAERNLTLEGRFYAEYVKTVSLSFGQCIPENARWVEKHSQQCINTFMAADPPLPQEKFRENKSSLKGRRLQEAQREGSWLSVWDSVPWPSGAQHEGQRGRDVELHRFPYEN